MASKSKTPLEISEHTQTVEFDLNKDKYKLTISNNSNKIQIKLEDLLSLKKDVYFLQTSLKELQKINRFFLLFENLEEVNNSLIKLVNKNNISISKETGKCQFIIENPINDEEFSIELEKTQDDSKDTDEEEAKDSIPLIAELKKKIEQLEKNKQDLEKRIESLEEKLQGGSNIVTTPKVLRSGKKKQEEEDNEEEELINSNIQIFKSSLISKKDEKVIRGFIGGQILSAELIFDTATDGDSIDAFKKKITNQSPTLFIIKTDFGQIFGAYATSNWIEKKYIADSKAFVYTINPNKKYNVTMPKFGLYGYDQQENIMFQFGSVCFQIKGKCTSDRINLARGSSYEKGFLDFIPGDHKFRVSRLEIFKVNF